MYLDSEKNQIEMLMLDLCINSTLWLNGNSFEKKIYKCISQFNKLTNNSGHNELPPDFYSDELNIMFDIYRVNDSEVKKTYNPTAIAERKIEQEIKQSWVGEICPQVLNNLICIDKNWNSNKIHKIDYYIKNIQRVTKDHLSSKEYSNKIKDIWVKEHPNITRKGLVIFDETEIYFQGQTIFNPQIKQWCFIWNSTKLPIIYEPWMDEKILQPIYESDCDFIIWFNPYKNCDLIRKTNVYYPKIVIIDTRYPRTNFIQYDYSKFVRA